MAGHDDSRIVGFSKPPRETRFVKGKSGNPKGRPKGSQNLSTILTKVGRERVTVTGPNGIRTITKLQACLTQLANQAASGELRAIDVLLYWSKSIQDSEQAVPTSPVPHERDQAGMANLIERIRHAEVPASTEGPEVIIEEAE